MKNGLTLQDLDMLLDEPEAASFESEGKDVPLSVVIEVATTRKKKRKAMLDMIKDPIERRAEEHRLKLPHFLKDIADASFLLSKYGRNPRPLSTENHFKTKRYKALVAGSKRARFNYVQHSDGSVTGSYK